MDPQKTPDTNQIPENPNPTPPVPDASSDVSPAEGSNAKPGTVVVGGQPEAPAPTPVTASEPPSPVGQEKMAEFMREPTTSDVPPAPTPAPGKSKAGLISLVIAAILLVFGGGAAYYFAYLVPNKPENVLKSALVNSFSKDKASSVAFDGIATLSEAGSGDKFSVDFSGASSQEGKINFTASIDALATKVTVDLRSLDGKTFYAKVGGLAGLPELMAQSGSESAAMYAPLLSAINDQWYEINESLIKELTGSTSATPALSDADRQKIAQAYESNPFLVVKETLASEKINGTDSYHYKVVIDGPKLEAFISAVEAAKIDSLGMTPEMFTSLKDGVKGANLSQYPVDVWIAKDSKLFTQLGFTYENDEGSATVRLTFKDYNKQVTVERPEDAKSILEIINTFYQSFLGTGFTAEDLTAEPTGISL